MVIDASIQWKINNPFLVLSIGLNVIQDGMKNLIQEVLRSTMADKNPDEAVQIHEKLRDHLEKKATEKSVDWGVKIKNVFITQLSFSDDVIKDYEKITREEQQKISEGTELDHVREQIEKFKNLGFSPESAKEMVQSERGKVPVTKTIEEKVYKGLEGTGVMGAVLDKFLSSKKGGGQ